MCMSERGMKQSVGLYFSESDLQLARDNLGRQPIAAALPLLDARRDDPLEGAQLLALRYLLLADESAAAAALKRMQRHNLQRLEEPDIAGFQERLGWFAVGFMLRAHPHWQATAQAGLEGLAGWALKLDTGSHGDPLRRCWLAALGMGAAILLGDEAGLGRAADSFCQIVDQHIHPEGYIKGIVDAEDASDTYAAQVSATRALVLMAEMAGQAGLDLWQYDKRGVSVMTAVAYSYFYYFFPEKWPWEAGLTREQTIPLMRRVGAFFEMANRRSALRGIEQLFAEQRPMFCALVGLTTLTHGIHPPKKRRWRIF